LAEWDEEGKILTIASRLGKPIEVTSARPPEKVAVD
jgi:hypothetical protein